MDAPRNHYNMHILHGRNAIQERVAEMGREISRDYAGKEITVIGALKGCFVFMADLVRHIDVPVSIDFIEVSSYEGTTSTGIVKIEKDFKHPITGRHVIIVEDIIDTGLTLNYLMETFELKQPASIKIAALLVKAMKQKLNYPIAYRGFDIDDDFVIGYGMDYRGLFRNLDHVAVLDPDTQLKLFP